MKTSLIVTVFITAIALAVSSFAQSSPAPGGKVANTGEVAVPANPATGQPNPADMMKQMMDVSGSMQMPGEDGKMKTMQFKGMGMEGYDNVKKKFVASWIDNMGTGIEFSEGTYDPATKSFTYTSEMEPVPGMKTAVREVIKIADNNH